MIPGELPPLALYAHFPWCTRKCPYCDFNSVATAEEIPEQTYIAALLADLDCDLRATGGRPLTSIYFGGGTPSLFSPLAITRLLTAIRDRVAVEADAEITLEANPGTVTGESLAGYHVAGVNRLSFGVQSLRDPMLARIGRIHDAAGARAAVAAARAAGFTNINIDLMFGLPGDDVAGAIKDLEQALAWSPEHLSWYQLTLEPNTEFGRRPPMLPDDDTIAEIHDRGVALLAAQGYRAYEVSAFASSGRESRHNLNYWRFGDYLGIGAGAHGKLTAPDKTILRTVKPHAPAAYQRDAGRADFGTRAAIELPADRILEFLLNALRLNDGFELDLFEQRTGLSRELLWPRLEAAQAAGLLHCTSGQVQPTARGRRFLNDLLLLFVDDGNADLVVPSRLVQLERKPRGS